MGAPPQRTVPESAESTPSAIRIVVVLPAPLLHETEQIPGAHIEGHILQRDDMPVTLTECVDLQ